MRRHAVALAAAHTLADGIGEPYAVLKRDDGRFAVESQSFLQSPMGLRRYGDRVREFVQPLRIINLEGRCAD